MKFIIFLSIFFMPLNVICRPTMYRSPAIWKQRLYTDYLAFSRDFVMMKKCPDEYKFVAENREKVMMIDTIKITVAKELKDFNQELVVAVKACNQKLTANYEEVIAKEATCNVPDWEQDVKSPTIEYRDIECLIPRTTPINPFVVAYSDRNKWKQEVDKNSKFFLDHQIFQTKCSEEHEKLATDYKIFQSLSEANLVEVEKMQSHLVNVISLCNKKRREKGENPVGKIEDCVVPNWKYDFPQYMRIFCAFKTLADKVRGYLNV